MIMISHEQAYAAYRKYMNEVDHLLEDYRAERKREIISLGRSSREFFVFCPTCGISQSIDFEAQLDCAAPRVEAVNCEHCQARFTVTSRVCYTTEKL